MRKLQLMDTKVTDVGLLGMTVMAAIQDHTGLVITAVGFVFVSVIRWQQHSQTMRNLKLDEKLKRQELDEKLKS